MAARLRERLVGAWRLVDVVEEAIDGSPVRRPHGERRWLGTGQVRAVKLDGDALELSTASPVQSGGRLVTTRISWERAEPSA